jgi:hypothetical protein
MSDVTKLAETVVATTRGHGTSGSGTWKCSTNSTTAEALRRAARTLRSSFKVPTVWLLLSSDDVPRGSTGGDVDRDVEEYATVGR